MQRYRGLALGMTGIALAIFGFVILELGIRQTTNPLSLGGLEIFGAVLAGLGALISLIAALLIKE